MHAIKANSGILLCRYCCQVLNCEVCELGAVAAKEANCKELTNCLVGD